MEWTGFEAYIAYQSKLDWTTVGKLGCEKLPGEPGLVNRRIWKCSPSVSSVDFTMVALDTGL